MLSPLLVLGLLGAAPAPPSSGACASWKIPGLVSTLEVPGEMSVGGIPIRLQPFSSREGVEALLASFVTAFSAAGFYVPERQPRFSAQPHLTALDPRTLTACTLVLETEPGGRLTSGVVGEARLGEARPVTAADGLPVYPGGKSALLGDFEGARTLTYRLEAPKVKEAQVHAWYREQLTRAGYTEEQPMLFRQRERELRLAVTARQGGLDVVLFLTTAEAPPPLSSPP